jgi:hypothetical protein
MHKEVPALGTRVRQSRTGCHVRFGTVTGRLWGAFSDIPTLLVTFDGNDYDEAFSLDRCGAEGITFTSEVVEVAA